MLRALSMAVVAVAVWVTPRAAVAKTKRSHPVEAESDSDSSPSAKALAAAEARWQNLRDDDKRSRLRCNWERVTTQLEKVADRYPKSPEAPKALLDAAQALEDLQHSSFSPDDVKPMMEAYLHVTAEFPGSATADDAHLALARIYRKRMHDDDHARSELQAVVKARHKGTPQLAEARQQLAKLGGAEPGTKHEKHASAHAAVASTEAAPEQAAAPAKIGKIVVKGEWEESEEPKARAPAKAAIASESSTAEVSPSLPAPIVPPEAIDGVRDGLAILPPASEKPAAVAESPKLYQASEIIPGKPDRERLDKDRLAALKSAVRTSGELPLSEQMGLKVRRVVVDAGHGGHDTGAIGPSGVFEKDVSLAVAKKLAEKLRAQGLEVFLTRSDDHFVSLEKRTAFANENRADLFVSVHCNAASDAKLRGVETYSLNVSSNQYAMRLAARENATSDRSISDLQYLLADLTTKANTADSRHLARTVQSSVVNGLRSDYAPIRDLGPKEALFYVLLGTRMPSILVEGSFISNPQEEHRLADPAFEDALAGSVAAGIARFVDEHQSLAGVPVVAGLP